MVISRNRDTRRLCGRVTHVRTRRVLSLKTDTQISYVGDHQNDETLLKIIMSPIVKLALLKGE